MSEQQTKDELVAELASLVRTLARVVRQADWYDDNGKGVNLSRVDKDFIEDVEDDLRRIESQLEKRS
jgi:hypothetical protein